jgi:hypothetical protein
MPPVGSAALSDHKLGGAIVKFVIFAPFAHGVVRAYLVLLGVHAAAVVAWSGRDAEIYAYSCGSGGVLYGKMCGVAAYSRCSMVSECLTKGYARSVHTRIRHDRPLTPLTPSNTPSHPPPLPPPLRSA